MAKENTGMGEKIAVVVQKKKKHSKNRGNFTKKVAKYRKSDEFLTGEVVKNDVFGEGIVTKLINNKLVEVNFGGSLRVVNVNSLYKV